MLYIFNRLREEVVSDAPGIRILCPSRQTVRAEGLQNVFENHEVLMKLWEK